MKYRAISGLGSVGGKLLCVCLSLTVSEVTMACGEENTINDLNHQIKSLKYQLNPVKGQLVNGKWVVTPFWEESSGEGISETRIQNWITADGRAGPTGHPGFKAEPGRYHLYVSLACPWAHRTLIFRKLKGLEDIISVSCVHTDLFNDGWEFKNPAPGLAMPNDTRDPLNGFHFLREVYIASKPDYTGRVSVPVLWDKKTKQIVNTESSEIIRMFNSAFNDITGNNKDYYPEALRQTIDEVNNDILNNINIGVYLCGFTRDQNAYNQAFDRLFATLDKLEHRLGQHRFLTGHQLTEADWRLFTTLIRFDTVYYLHFKTNRNRIEDFKNLSAYLRDLYQMPGIAETVNFEHIKRHYYISHKFINPSSIIPKGPVLNLLKPHNRDLFINNTSDNASI